VGESVGVSEGASVGEAVGMAVGVVGVAVGAEVVHWNRGIFEGRDELLDITTLLCMVPTDIESQPMNCTVLPLDW
jgi:hypothetical protein